MSNILNLRERALMLQRLAGTQAAAEFLKAAGWSPEQAVSLLARRKPQ